MFGKIHCEKGGEKERGKEGGKNVFKSGGKRRKSKPEMITEWPVFSHSYLIFPLPFFYAFITKIVNVP